MARIPKSATRKAEAFVKGTVKGGAKKPSGYLTRGVTPTRKTNNAATEHHAKGPVKNPVKGGAKKPTGSLGGSKSTQPASSAATPPANAATAPFLTPAQQRALSSYDSAYGYNLGALNRRIGDATANTNQRLAAASHTAGVNTNNANQNAAARGIFQSSIRDADLNDIDATLAMRNNTLNTNLNSLILDTNSRIGNLTTGWTNTHNFYNSMAVANAQSVPPVVPAPTTPTMTTAGSSGAAASGSSSSAAKGGTPAGTGGGGGRIQGGGSMGSPRMPRGRRGAPRRPGGTGFGAGPATAQYFNGVGVPQ